MTTEPLEFGDTHAENDIAARVTQACRLIDAQLDAPHGAQALAAAFGLSESALRRGFLRVLGISPKAYLDAKRLEAFAQSAATSVTDAMYDAGYSGPSRLYAQAGPLGMPPARFRAGGAGETLHYVTLPTKVGALIVAATRWGLACVQLGDDAADVENALRDRFPAADIVPALPGSPVHGWAAQVAMLVEQSELATHIPLDIRGTAFQRRVWNHLQSIPAGQTQSYAEVAQAIGASKAVRAVGTACGANRLAIVVPCHRVLRGDGSMGGYRWGLPRKQELLAREQSNATIATHD